MAGASMGLKNTPTFYVHGPRMHPASQSNRGWPLRLPHAVGILQTKEHP
jgi:hypothetical protein